MRRLLPKPKLKPSVNNLRSVLEPMKRVLMSLLLCVSFFTDAEAHHPLREQVAVAATSYGVLRLAVYPTKHWVSERRPDKTDYKSFPSGHTATAFMGAELVREEYGNVWGAGAYALATGVGVMRVCQKRHYTHDVVAGAAIGFLSARVGYWLLPLESRLFGWDKKKTGTTVTVVPVYNSDMRAPALSVAASW